MDEIWLLQEKKTGKNSFVSKNGSWIKEGDLYLNSKLAGNPTIILLRNSLALRNTKKSVNYHSNSEEIPLDNDKAVEILEKAKKGSSAYHILGSRNSIATKDFGKNEDTVWLFKDLAEEYGDFLHSNGIKIMPLYFDGSDSINNQENAYINQLWLGSLPGSSNINGSSWDLYNDNGAFGVPDKTAGGGSQKNSLDSRELAKTIVNDYISKLTYNEKITVKGIEQTINDFKKVK